VRRIVLAGLGASLLLVAVAPAEAAVEVAPTEAPAETSASMRARRTVLLQRIAALTDEAAVAEVWARDTARARYMSQVALEQARTRFAQLAVGAYVSGVQESQASQLRLRAWGDSLTESDLQVIGDFRAARDVAAKDSMTAEIALAEATRARAELDAARTQLERTIEERVRIERDAARIRAAAQRRSGVPRHQRSTMSQYELMSRYRFGPGGVPDGLVATGQVIEGKASWYGPGFDGRPTASGAIYDQEGWTVAHRTLPLGTILLISREGRSVVALVNDRGPFVNGRILDLSHGVANALGTVHAGVATVRAEILVPA
jgi:rare lipoprotein A (peptidoglycan hydrolase)